MALINIVDTDNWTIDYDKETNQYRVNYFEEFHFTDEIWFDGYTDDGNRTETLPLKDNKSTKLNERIFQRKLLKDEEFFFALARYLDDKFSKDKWWDKNCTDSDLAITVIDTFGWQEAVEKALTYCNLDDCLQYYQNTDDWTDKEILDIEIVNLLESIIFNESGRRVYF